MGRQKEGEAPCARSQHEFWSPSPSAPFLVFLRNDRNQEILLGLAGFCPGLSNPEKVQQITGNCTLNLAPGKEPRQTGL